MACCCYSTLVSAMAISSIYTRMQETMHVCLFVCLAIYRVSQDINLKLSYLFLGQPQRERQERKRALFVGQVKSTDLRGKTKREIQIYTRQRQLSANFFPSNSRLFWNTVLGSFSLLLLYSLSHPVLSFLSLYLQNIFPGAGYVWKGSIDDCNG